MYLEVYLVGHVFCELSRYFVKWLQHIDYDGLLLQLLANTCCFDYMHLNGTSGIGSHCFHFFMISNLEHVFMY